MVDRLRNKLIDKAERMGAEDVAVFTIDDIVFDSRTLIQCMFGCEDWGQGLTCPSQPEALKPWEYRRIFSNYEWGLIVHTHSKSLSQKISFELEKMAFQAGCYFAISLSDCALCEECAGVTDSDCRHPQKARPAFHSVGIDVFKTVHQFGLPLKTLEDEKEEQNWYSAVFVE